MVQVVRANNPPAELVLSPVPNIKQPAAAARWITENLGIPVTESYIQKKTKQRQIAYSVIGGRRYYSSQALYDFIMSCNKTGANPGADPWAV